MVVWIFLQSLRHTFKSIIYILCNALKGGSDAFQNCLTIPEFLNEDANIEQKLSISKILEFASFV